jgi:16S rRNA (guanine527-N7)-methyltransferase
VTSALTPEQFCETLSAAGVVVSRETLEQLQLYANMLADWQAQMNLVGASTLADVWGRHMLDSAQLAAFIPELGGTTIVDLGSGAGFPGMVLAILGAQHVTLIDSVGKKCRFMQAVADALGIAGRVSVTNRRIEELSPFSTQFITSRACAPLERLIPWGYRFKGKDMRWLLLKGENVDAELAVAAENWTFDQKQHQSLSDPRGKLLELSNVRWRHR